VRDSLALGRMRQRRHDVFHVSAFYPPHIGGLENVAQTLAEQLADRHDMHVITTTCGSDGAPILENKAGVQVRRFVGFCVANTPVSLSLALRLLVLRRRSIIHVHIAHAFVPEVVFLTSMLRRRRYVAHFHVDIDPTGPLGFLLKSYKRWILGPSLRRAAAVIALSPQQADFLESNHGVSRQRIVVLPNGVDPAFFRPLEDTKEPVVRQRPLRILNVGRLDPGKGLLRLVDAMTHVSSDVELVIVGEGGLREEVASRIDRLGLTNVTLAGAARGPDLVRWYRWADVFVMPSDKEGMPLVVLEAMAGGLAIVSTNAPGLRELVEGVGLLTELGPEALGAAIERVATEPDLLRKLSVGSAARGLQYRWDAAVTELEHIYDSVAIT
jgi:glycosyltransferase involved in cell wall biosynthesis